MSASSMISLFSERPELVQKPYSFVFSILAHCAAFGLIFLGIMAAPRVTTHALAERYEVRHLDLHTLESEMQRARRENKPPRPHPPKEHNAPTAKKPDTPKPVMQMATQAPKGPQTLVQPDIPKPIAMTAEIPLPTVVIWQAKKPLVKTIVPPPPQNPPIINVKPSIQLPNEELNLADIAIPATAQAAINQPIVASTTTPVVVSGPEQTQAAPLTTAAGSALPTATALISLSDNNMANGAVTLPPVNSSAANSPGSLAPGSKDGKAAGGADDDTDQTGSGLGFRPTVTHILRQKGGSFGSVVVGSTLEDKYPEMIKAWSGRLSYTVYLSVGLSKSWILQYSVSRDDSATAAGNIAHIDAPWPYSIMRPNIAPGSIDADALMIHGYVNQAGRFEALSVAFPPQFPQAQFVLSALYQWQFRPATQNGQSIKVEVLLIIPEVFE